ncbi:16S rRNA (cytidine1402-2'-O)-methyltransferase [Saccharicrinis carchari]|uniref:16S rRNA (Cytidine1402-2'-O)-methyltransferase n=1 Tax=Saccharicrinis carchari TaxID=1168039 RepID=A0A521B204_SACCC|nr:SAM-dependent methyltransferase [Saccharicrinis carchari]SMO41117.1 16S rRNA (cytidine1402-2'-O)-methyltransferase [Saccharicrinis carchari]
MKGTLYLIPTTLGDSAISSVIPADVVVLLKQIKFFIVEDIRSTRRYLKKADKSINIDELTFFELNKHTTVQQKSSYLNVVRKGNNVGVISEAGCPGVADPGADIVAAAHQQNIKVVPLVGPSSILLSLMASGLNGQSFAFHGYLPIKSGERAKAIAQLEGRSIREKQTQIFIEAPYRNNHLLKDILAVCNAKTKVGVACDITLKTEFIKTKSVAQWKGSLPELHKKPTIFLIQG